MLFYLYIGDRSRRRAKPVAPNGANLPSQRLQYVCRANARMKLRVLGTLLSRSNDAQYNSAAREEARFRTAEWDNYLRHGPRGQAEYHHGFEHCI